MAELHYLKTFASESGNLTVFETSIPGKIERVFYIYGVGPAPRAGHRHHRAWNAVVCLTGQCRVYCHNGRQEQTYHLSDPRECLVLKPEDWHIMDGFSEGVILLVASNQPYDQADYIYEPYPNSHLLAHSA